MPSQPDTASKSTERSILIFCLLGEAMDGEMVDKVVGGGVLLRSETPSVAVPKTSPSDVF